ncbi:MAG: GNAT family N-acetyltransferase [Ginsengibacter sp.]
MNDKILIRKITADDDAKIAFIIRSCLEEFSAVKPGTVYFDETTDHLYNVFQTERSAYFIVEINGEVFGGAGIFPTESLPPKTCELVKMYLLSKARGKGIGKLLLQKCMEEARNKGFEKMYLESMPELVNAIAMYEKNGFTFITKPLGNSGHTGCDVFMIKELLHEL